jgi:chromosome segregation ATPase
MEAKVEIPTMSIATIVEMLNKLNIKVTVKEFNKPTFDLIYRIYSGLLENCLFVPPTTFQMEPADIFMHFSEETIKSNAEAFKLFHFYLLIKYFMEMCGITMSFSETFNPTKKQFKDCVTTMINFAKLESVHLIDFQKIQIATAQYSADCKKARMEIEDLSSRIYLMKAQQAEKKPLIEAKIKQIANLKDRIAHVQEERRKTQQVMEAALKEEHAIHTEREEIRVRHQNIDKKMLLYEKLLIKSPERLNREYKNNEARIIEIEKVIRSKTLENEELNKKIFEREKFVENFGTIKETLENFYHNDVHKANVQIKELDALKEDILSANFENEQILSIISTFNDNYNKLMNKIEAHNLETEKKLIQITEQRDQCQHFIEERKKEIKRIEEKTANLKEEKENTLKEINQVTEDAVKKIKEIKKMEEIDDILVIY